MRTVRRTPKQWEDALMPLRDAGYLMRIRFYCEGPDCPTRTFEVTIKDLDNELLALVGKRGVICPICGGANITLHGSAMP